MGCATTKQLEESQELGLHYPDSIVDVDSVFLRYRIQLESDKRQKLNATLVFYKDRKVIVQLQKFGISVFRFMLDTNGASLINDLEEKYFHYPKPIPTCAINEFFYLFFAKTQCDWLNKLQPSKNEAPDHLYTYQGEEVKNKFFFDAKTQRVTGAQLGFRDQHINFTYEYYAEHRKKSDQIKQIRVHFDFHGIAYSFTLRLGAYEEIFRPKKYFSTVFLEEYTAVHHPQDLFN